MEIIDNLLWFPGYSVYLTDWCKAYLQVKVNSPQGLKSYDMVTIYKDILLVWYAHHLQVEFPPLPPRLHHLELAYSQVINSNNKFIASGYNRNSKQLPMSYTKQPRSFVEVLKSIRSIFNA